MRVGISFPSSIVPATTDIEMVFRLDKQAKMTVYLSRNKTE
jgi:hypothetical protein